MNTCTYRFFSLFRHLILCLILFCLSPSLYAQPGTDAQLANHYYNNGDYAKAKEYYEKLYKREPIKLYFERYYQCLIAESDWKTAEKILKQSLKKLRLS